MKKRFRLTFNMTELFVLLFELLVGSSGVMMLVAGVRGNANGLELPALAVSGVLPVLLVVGFSAWLVYRLRCVGRARSRFGGLAGAICLGVTAIGFGAAVGKLSLVLLSAHQSGLFERLMADPVLREGGFSTLVAFMAIGLVFAVTFVVRAGKRDWSEGGTSESLHEQVAALGEKFVADWSEQLVSRVDALVEQGRMREAIQLYEQSTACSLDEAACTIADWPAHRVRLELEVLSRELQASPPQPISPQPVLAQADSSESGV